MTALYVPPTDETDHKKQNQSLQLIGGVTSTNTTNITANTASIVTNTANIVTNTANIVTNTAAIAQHEAAWTAWTPTVVPASGAFTTVSSSGAYLAMGKTVHFTITITITTAGTAAGDMSVALPVGTAKRDAIALSIETAVIGTVGFSLIASGGTTITRIRRSDNSTWIASGRVVVVTGIYEQT